MPRTLPVARRWPPAGEGCRSARLRRAVCGAHFVLRIDEFNLWTTLAGVGVLLNIASETKRESGAGPRGAGVPADEKQEVTGFESDSNGRRVGSGPDNGLSCRNESCAIWMDGSMALKNQAIAQYGQPGCGRLESVG